MISNKGQIGLPLHFKRFGQSPNYYFNKYGVRPSNGKPPGRRGKVYGDEPGDQKKMESMVKKRRSLRESLSF
ncbi:hypothetical protein DIU36_21315 [Mucilaginibacter rubeus]|nr:hypothetical protein DIU36_21315 [Mucilaginibacter rubeus]